MGHLKKSFAATMIALVFTALSTNAAVDLTGNTNLAIGKTASASTNDVNRAAENAVDGNNGTTWGPDYDATGEKDGSWWKLDLGSAQAFTTIRINYNNQAPKKAKIEISNNNTEWTEVAQVGSDYSNAGDNNTYIYKIGHRNAQYIRISCIEGGAYGMGFNEFEVYNHTYYLTAITVSPSVVNKYINSNITVTGTDNEGDPYYEFSLNGATTGTVINAVNASLGQYSIVFNIEAIGTTETITATDSNDNTKTATTTIDVQSPVITSFVMVNDNAKKDFVNAGDQVELWVYDQFNGIVALDESVTFTATTGTPTAVGNTLTYTVPALENGGTITISVTKGGTTLTHNLYMLGNNLPAPRIPTDVYKPVITVFDNADSHIHFTYGTDGTTVDATAYTPNGLYVKRIIQDKSIVVGRNDNSVFPNSNASGQINWNPAANGAGKLKADIFASNTGNQVWFKIEGGSTTTPVTLNQGWNTIEWDCSAFNSNITAIRVESKRADDTYPDVLITNMYFTKAITDEGRPSFVAEYPNYKDVTRYGATLTLKGTDTDSETLQYIIYKKIGENYEIFKSLSAANNTEAEVILTGLTPETSYTYKVELYDLAGNTTVAAAPEVTFTTKPTSIVEIRGTVDKPNSTEKDIAEQIFEMNTPTTTKPVFTIIDEDGNEVAEGTQGLDIKYVILHDELGILSTTGLPTVAVENTDMPYNTTGKFNIVNGKTGTAVIRIIATYKDGNGGVAIGHYGISVFNPALTLTTFTVLAVNDGTETYTKQEDGTSPISGTHGNLKEIINARLTAAQKSTTYMDVTEITIEGTLDSRDLRTLREMGGVKFNITTNSKGFTAEQMAAHPYYFENDAHLNDYRGEYNGYGTPGTGTHGNLHTLNLANATFTVVSMEETKAAYNNDAAWDALSDEEKAALNQSDNILVTLPVEEGENTWDFVDWRNTGNLHNINQFAFMGCVNLEEVTLPNVTNLMIGMHAFEHCENLQKVNNMDKVTWFGDYCFNQDKSLVGGNSANVSNQSCVEFSSALTYIGYVAFQNCENMKLYSRHLPDNINHIGDQAFASCKGFDSYIVYPNNPSLDIAHMATGVFLNCSNLQQVYIPSTTVTFGYVEFQGCSKLTDVNFYNAAAPAWTADAVTNEKPTDINQEAYSANLVNVIANAFDGCVVLKDENFQRLYNTKLIGSAAFADCKLMTNTSFNILIKHFCDGNDQDNKSAGNGKVLSNEASLCDYTLPYRAFHGCNILTTVDFNQCDNNVVGINDEAFSNCSALTTVTLPAALTTMGDIVFANCTSLQTVTVQNPVAPTMDHETLTYKVTVKIGDDDVEQERDADIFLNTPSEKVEIIFPEALKTANDASGYKTYRANAHFMNAMKRTLNESAATYDVTPQYGADVTLNRTFKADQWNTLVLPFGLQNNNSRTGHTANVLSSALNDGTIAAYRGVSNDRTFVFMTYEDADAVKAFMPVITYTTTETVSPVFEDVDVNFNDAGEKIAAASMNVIAYSGNKGDAIPADNDNLDSQYTGTDALETTDFKFTGAFKTVYSAGGLTLAGVSGTADINDGDYIIQSNAFYEVQNAATSAYRIKAFRGWFQKQEGSSAKSAVMNIMAVNGSSDITDEIVYIDTENGEQIKPENIYSLNGTLVRSNAITTDGLPKGIYIKGGKKIVVR